MRDGSSWRLLHVRLPFRVHPAASRERSGLHAFKQFLVLRLPESERSAQVRSAHVWRGSARSIWSDVRLRTPSEEERTYRLNNVERGIASDECDAIEVANFFRVVRDERAPDLLLRLLETRPYNIWLLDAIVVQGRASDARRLRDLALKVDDPSIRQHFIDAAVKLERSSERRDPLVCVGSSFALSSPRE